MNLNDKINNACDLEVNGNFEIDISDANFTGRFSLGEANRSKTPGLFVVIGIYSPLRDEVLIVRCSVKEDKSRSYASMGDRYAVSVAAVLAKEAVLPTAMEIRSVGWEYYEVTHVNGANVATGILR
jgi:hypothetical protein